MKKAAILLFMFVLIGITIHSLAQESPYHLQQRYQKLETETKRLRAEGYDVTELFQLNRKIIQAYKDRDFKEVQELLGSAEEITKAFKPGKQIVVEKQDKPFQGRSTGFNPFGLAFGDVDSFEKYGSGTIRYVRAANATDFGIHVYWSTIEPVNNNYDWTVIDTFVRQIQPGDNAHIMIFTDGWCTTQGRRYKGSPLKNQKCKSEYRAFLRDLALHVNGKIKYWQRDIEPGIRKHWPVDEVNEYIEMQKIFYKEIKDIIPDAHVGGLGIYALEFMNKQNQRDFVDAFFQSAEDYFDYLDIHLYKDKYAIPKGLHFISTMMKRHGYQKPLIIKEAGGPTAFEYEREYSNLLRQVKAVGGTQSQSFRWMYKWFDDNFNSINPKIQIFLKKASLSQNAKRDRIECRDILQRYMIILSSGAQKALWWNLIEHYNPYGPQPIFGKLPLLSTEHTKNSAFFCYRRMTGKLKGISSVDKISLSDTSLYFYRITKSNQKRPLYVLWHHDEGVDSYDDDTAPAVQAKVSVDLSGKVNITDVFGKFFTKSVIEGKLLIDVDNTPLYIEATE